MIEVDLEFYYCGKKHIIKDNFQWNELSKRIASKINRNSETITLFQKIGDWALPVTNFEKVSSMFTIFLYLKD